MQSAGSWQEARTLGGRGERESKGRHIEPAQQRGLTIAAAPPQAPVPPGRPGVWRSSWSMMTSTPSSSSSSSSSPPPSPPSSPLAPTPSSSSAASSATTASPPSPTSPSLAPPTAGPPPYRASSSASAAAAAASDVAAMIGRTLPVDSYCRHARPESRSFSLPLSPLSPLSLERRLLSNPTSTSSF